MTHDGSRPVAVSRLIRAPANVIFDVLADPQRHPELDGSGMLRAGSSNCVITGVGDVFVMKMHNAALGNYEMSNHVVVFELNRRIGWEPALRSVEDPEKAPTSVGQRVGHRWMFELTPQGSDATTVTEMYDCSGAPPQVRALVNDGNGWIDSMSATLVRLNELCTR